jgi:hypothetical protein
MTTLDDTEQIAKELDAIFDLYNATKTNELKPKRETH